MSLVREELLCSGLGHKPLVSLVKADLFVEKQALGYGNGRESFTAMGGGTHLKEEGTRTRA